MRRLGRRAAGGLAANEGDAAASGDRARPLSRRQALRLLAAAGLAGAGASVPGGHAGAVDSAAGDARPASDGDDGAASDDGARSAGGDGGTSSAPGDEPPAWTTFREVELEADVDADGVPELLRLRGRRLLVTKGDRTLLGTDANWQVSDVLVADFDADGVAEVAALLWKRGSYGSSRPFWEVAASGVADAGSGAADAGNPDDALSQHLFVYRWREGGLRPLWMSSRLGVDARCVGVVPPPADGSGGRPRLRVISREGRVTEWEWLSWGFALVGEVDGGDASDGSADIGAFAGDAVGDDGLTLLVVGDNIAHESVLARSYDPAARAYDFSPLYEHVADRVRAYDLSVVCQETVLVENPARASGYPLFATPQAMGDALAAAGFDVVLGATNHANDQGPAALGEECAYWACEHPEVELAGVHADPSGVGAPTYVENGGVRLALFDYTYGLNGRDLPEDEAWRVDVLAGDGERRLVDGVAAAREAVDLVICFLHVGREYESDPTPEQVALVERLIDAGAAAVACSHAHVIGPWGHVTTSAGNEGLALCGLGNFVSGQCDDVATVVGAAAVLRVERLAAAGAADGQGAADASEPAARVASCELLPVVLHADALDGSMAAYFLDDYTDELAARHVLSTADAPLTTAALRALAISEGRRA
jgi:poly-gamma-glutamate capsule biosynthesis protein CapA/YwtB (metallophosphatase superfamily)